MYCSTAARIKLLRLTASSEAALSVCRNRSCGKSITTFRLGEATTCRFLRSGLGLSMVDSIIHFVVQRLASWNPVFWEVRRSTSPNVNVFVTEARSVPDTERRACVPGRVDPRTTSQRTILPARWTLRIVHRIRSVITVPVRDPPPYVPSSEEHTSELQ